MSKKRIILSSTLAAIVIVVIITVVLCIKISNQQQNNKTVEYKIVDSNNVSYSISFFRDYRDNNCFSIDNSPKIYFDTRPEKIVRLVSEDNNILYWIYYDETFEMLLYTDGIKYESFVLTEQGEYDPISISEKCLSFLSILVDQKIMDRYTEIENKSYWYTRISAVVKNS